MDRGHHLQRTAIGEYGEALAEGPVARLIVVLEEVHEGLRWQVCRGLAAHARKVLAFLALQRVALGQAAQEVAPRILRVVDVVALRLARQQHVGRVVEVVVPLTVVEGGEAIVVALVQAGDVSCILGRQVPPPREATVGLRFTHRAGDILDDVPTRCVLDRVDRIEPQSVDPVLTQPEQRVVDHEIAHGLAVVRDGRAPGRVVLGMVEVGRVNADVVPVRPEMVEHDVEKDAQAARVRFIDQTLQIVRRSIGLVGRVE